MNKKILTSVQDLLDTAAPDEWISYLFDLNNALIAHNHFEDHTKLGTLHHATKIGTLKNFFSELKNQKLTNS